MGIEGALPQGKVIMSQALKYQAAISIAGNNLSPNAYKTTETTLNMPAVPGYAASSETITKEKIKPEAEKSYNSNVNNLYKKLEHAQITIKKGKPIVKNARLSRDETLALREFINITLTTEDGQKALAANNKDYKKQLDKLNNAKAKEQAKKTEEAARKSATQKNNDYTIRIMEQRVMDLVTDLKTNFPDIIQELKFVKANNEKLGGNSWTQEGTTLYASKDSVNDIQSTYTGLNQVKEGLEKASDEKLTEEMKQDKQDALETVKTAYYQKYNAMDTVEKDRFNSKYGNINNFLSKLTVNLSYSEVATSMQEVAGKYEVTINKDKADYCQAVITSNTYGDDFKNQQLTAFNF